MSSADTQFLSISEAAQMLRRHEVSAFELTQACLDRIEKIDPRINSFITVTGELALEQAELADVELAAGKDRGPLQGIPVALKDLYMTNGIRTTAHSKVLQDWVPDQDATTTHKLREAGAVLVGKLAMHEFAFGAPVFDTPFPPARNPWNVDHVTGGSSTGSGAALAAGLCFGSLGSDSGGSVRNPASQCGIVGLKATYGRVSRHGLIPLGWSVDHAGPMARTVGDTALLLQAIAGPDSNDPASANEPVPNFSSGLGDGVRGLRFGVPRQWLDEGAGTAPDVREAFESALEVLRSLGARIEDVDSAPFIESRPANTMILTAEAYAIHELTLQTRPQDLSKHLRTRLREGAFISAADYIQAQRARTTITDQIQTILTEHDAILSPTTPGPGEAFDDFGKEVRYSVPSFTIPGNLTGLPAISVPCGFTPEGLPIGLQIAGRAFDEASILRIAHAFEEATPWNERHPII